MKSYKSNKKRNLIYAVILVVATFVSFIFWPHKDPNAGIPLQVQFEKTIAAAQKSGTASQVSVFFQDINSGENFEINKNEKYIPASLTKVAIMFEYLKAAEFNPDLLQTRILYDGKANLSEGYDRIKFEDQMTPGVSYTVDDLLRRMIVHSDNNPVYVLLTRGLDANLLGKTYTDFGMTTSLADLLKDNFSVNPKDFSNFFISLTKKDYLNEAMTQKALGWLESAEFHDGLVAGSNGATVAHKFGEVQPGEVKQLHDCGIVYQKHQTYVLCVMTKGADESKMQNVIRDIAKLASTHEEFKK